MKFVVRREYKTKKHIQDYALTYEFSDVGTVQFSNLDLVLQLGCTLRPNTLEPIMHILHHIHESLGLLLNETCNKDVRNVH